MELITDTIFQVLIQKDKFQSQKSSLRNKKRSEMKLEPAKSSTQE